MNMEIVERDTFWICGYWVETTLEQNDKDVAALYDDFFCNGKEEILMRLQGSRKGYYGLSWYTDGHERYCYLLGIEVAQRNNAPDNSILKEIPKTTYAVARFPKGEDIIKAWTEFFYHTIPDAGYNVNAIYNLYFEYYPSGIKEEFELWVPVVSANH